MSVFALADAHAHADTGRGGRQGARGRGAFPLLGAALEGVRRFGHHLSVDYFADLSGVLVRLLRSRRLALPLRLQALATGVAVARCVL